jgi:Ca2+/H+ antiporter
LDQLASGMDGYLQTSLNLAFGSALACIGLTIPAVALASVLIGMPLALGLHPEVLLVLNCAAPAEIEIEHD